ncbi:MAG: TraR/DksA family transcriptional regulator [Candidatus Krumholzibacteria bacterium]|nr:TraR/DksA family transcriptional regulator [Candidatus Krumholzibacteria bacterium]
MNKRDLQRFKKLIEAEKQRVMERIGMIEEEIHDLAASQTGGQSYSNHMADIGSEAIEQEQAFMHASQGTDYLIALEEAMKRIEKGTYGTCEECGDKIPQRRLEAFPAAKLCIRCKSKLEKLHRG